MEIGRIILMDKDKVLIVSPAGACGNYIALTLLNKIDHNEFSYHEQGTHGNLARNITHIHTWADGMTELLNDNSYFHLQNDITNKFWIVLINWFEKFYYNPAKPKDKAFGIDWIRTQENFWRESEDPLVRAILNWFYAYKNNNRPECGRIDAIKNTFDFGSLYTSYESARSSFAKLGLEYNEDNHNKWKQSQSIVFESIEQIESMQIANLDKDYQKAIKMGLLGVQNNLNEQECWQTYKKYLN